MPISPAVGCIQCYTHPSVFPHQEMVPQGLVGPEALCEYLLLIAAAAFKVIEAARFVPYLDFVESK